MNEIAIDDLRRMLPESKTENPSDEYYLTLAQYIDKLLASMHVFPELDSSIRRRMVLDLTGYYQDIVSDAGLWRSFVKMNRFLYQRPVPFYKEPEDYVDSELNLIDVQFVAWYSLESQLGFLGLVSPFDSDLIRLSRQVYKLFAFLYDDAPVVENFKSLRELDLSDREQVRDIFKAYGWLFWNSYFMRPVSKHAYEQGVDAVGDAEGAVFFFFFLAFQQPQVMAGQHVAHGASFVRVDAEQQAEVFLHRGGVAVRFQEVPRLHPFLFQPGGVPQEVHAAEYRARRCLTVAVLFRQPCRMALHPIEAVEEVQVAAFLFDGILEVFVTGAFVLFLQGKQPGQVFQFVQPVLDDPVVQAGVCLEGGRLFPFRCQAVAVGKIACNGGVSEHVVPRAERTAPSGTVFLAPLFPAEGLSAQEVEAFQPL